MTDAVQQWIETLPRRWAIGGAVLGLVWILGGFVLMGWTMPGVFGLVILTGLILMPCTLLGGAWGCNERLAMRDAAAGGEAGIERRLADEYHFAQGGRGAACGVVYALIFFVVETLGLASAPGSSAFWMIPGAALLGFGIGVIVGNVARFNLRRRIRRAGETAPASS